MHFNSNFSDDKHTNTHAAGQGKLMKFGVLCFPLFYCLCNTIPMESSADRWMPTLFTV